MTKITLNRAIVKNIFGDAALREELITVLNDLIDLELQKSDEEADFDLVDAYCEALSALYDGKDIETVFWKLQTVEELGAYVQKNKHYPALRRASRVAAAACALFALLFTVNAVTEKTTGVDMLGEVAQAIRSAVVGETQGLLPEPTAAPSGNSDTRTQTEPTTEAPTISAAPVTERSTEARPHITPQNPDLTEVLSPTTPPTEKETEPVTRPPFTRPNENETAAPVLVKLYGVYASDFKRDYVSGESADFTGLTVRAVYDNGEEKVIPIEHCTVRGFSTETPANRIVTVEYADCSFSFLIRVK